jgi:hypothetical protein
MKPTITRLTNRTIQEQLLDAYSEAAPTLQENDTIRVLKGELYRRGYQDTQVIEIALAGLLRHQRRAS